MKKFCNKISNNQWRVTVPNLNTTIFRKSTSSCEMDAVEKKRVSSGSYDIPAAQREYDLHGRVTTQSQHSLPQQSDSSSTGSYQDACQEEGENTELYDVVDVHNPSVRIVESRNLSEANNRYEYDVPRIHFCFIEQKQQQNQKLTEINDEETQHDYENNIEVTEYSKINKLSKSKQKHRSQLQIYVTNVIDLNESQVTGNPVIKFGSDPNLKLSLTDDHDHEHHDDDSDGSDAFYKVPRRIDHYQIASTSNRLSKSLHDFNMDELDLPQLSLSVESIEHISCSQVLPNMSDDTTQASTSGGSSSKKSARKARWESFKSKFERFNRTMEDQAAVQRVGAFQNHDKYAINLEGMYKSSKDKCKKIINKTGKMFKRQEGAVECKATTSDNSSQIVKNDAFFAKITANDIEYVLPKRENDKNDKKDSEDVKDDNNEEIQTENVDLKDSNESESEKTDKVSDIKDVRSENSKVSETWTRKRISGAIAEEVMQVRNNFRKSRLQLEVK